MSTNVYLVTEQADFERVQRQFGVNLFTLQKAQFIVFFFFFAQPSVNKAAMPAQ